MEFLGGTKKLLRFLNIYTRPPLNLYFTEVSSHFIEYFAFVSMIVTTIPIGAFSLANFDNFKVASEGVLYFIANLSIKVIYLALLIKRKSVVAAIDHLEQLIANRVVLYPEMEELFASRAEINNNLTQTLIRSGIYTVLFFFVPNAAPPFLHILFGWPKDLIWNFPFPVVVPFDTETYLGFYIELCLQMFTVHFYMLIFSCMISLFYAFHKFIVALITDYSTAANNLNKLLDDGKPTKNSNKKIDPEIKIMKIQRFLKLSIELHIGILNTMQDLQNITSGPLFFELFTFVAFLAINVFVFDRALREESLENFEILFCLNNQLIQTVFCYVLCSFATKITSAVNEVTEITYDTSWYNFPPKEQLYLKLIIQRSHVNFQFSGFGIINCTVATFLSLCRTAGSYYIILRESN